MKIKKIIKIFIPPIILMLKKKICTLKSKENNNAIISTVSELKKNHSKFLIIGNGPSLLETIKKSNIQKLKEYDIIAVNHFCKSEYYKIIKPNFYLLADPDFFGKIEFYEKQLKTEIHTFIDCFINNTNWDICLVVPSFAFNSEFIMQCKKNNYIHVYYYNPFNTITYNEEEKYQLWDKNLLSVPAQTCLNTCLWLGIFLRYNPIYLIGADTTWLELLHVDQITNEIYTIDSHFYGSQKKILYNDAEGKTTKKLYEELDSISNALKKYWELKEYADYAGVKVYNASEYSLIDAFERKKL